MAKLKVLRNARGSKWCSVCFMGCSWLTTFKLEQSRSTSFTSCVLCLTIGITIGKSYWYHNWCQNLQMHWGSSGYCSKASRTGHVPGLALEKFCSSSQLFTVLVQEFSSKKQHQSKFLPRRTSSPKPCVAHWFSSRCRIKLWTWNSSELFEGMWRHVCSFCLACCFGRNVFLFTRCIPI